MTFAMFHPHHSTSSHIQRPARFVVALLASTALTVPPVLAGDALPTGGQVVSGAVSIGTSGTATTIVQSSDKAIVNWTGFSVGAGNAVNIVQPGSSSALLNRVTGATTSTIAGSVTANGQVYLINPNGIAITSSGSVKVGGGFVASTLDMSNEDFLGGRNTFKGSGASAGVSNAGIITVGRGGYAALIGGTVKNDGLIAVPMGRIGLGSGEQATLDLSGDGFLQVAVPTAAGAEGNGALIENAGTVSAEGGTVVMRAATARNAARNAINLSGVVEARSVSGRDGEITLGGGEGGKVALSGKVKASSSSGKGGKITITGKDIALKGATVDASGATGGGTVKIGGDRQGSGTTPHAETASIDAASAIHADATETGKGGDITVWSDNHTGFAGLITARGAGAGINTNSGAGADARTGGEVEVSGKALLDYTGFTDLSGPGGFGTLLLDPYNVTISSGAASNSSGTTAIGNDSVINAATLANALSAANVTITTGASGSAGGQAGDITVADDVTWTSGSALTLSAYGSITLNANLSGGTGATVVLRADNSATGTGTVSFGSGATVTASGGVSIFYNPANYASPTSYSANMGSGTSVTASMLVNTLANLQAINTNLSGTYALGNDIDASATATWNGGAGFSPIGSDSYRFTGMFDGQGHTISGLTINRSSSDNVGLFGYSSGAIRNVGLVGGGVAGSSYVGGLVGINDGSINNAYATGSVTISDRYVGGLVGVNYGSISSAYATGSVTYYGSFYAGAFGGLVGIQVGGSISNAYATGTVTAGGYPGSTQGYVGGLVGSQVGGSISNSYATGSVKGDGSIGGLVGSQGGGSISNSYATGSVKGDGFIGGLVGSQYGGSISNSYATGSVTLSSSGGGLIGYSNSGTITASFFDKETTGQSNGVGIGSDSGVTGLTTAQARDSSYYGWNFSDVWYQSGDMRPILRSEAAVADAQGIVTITNLHQLALIETKLSGRYVLSANLDASATSGSNASDIWGTAGWMPLGDGSDGFTGMFDGQGHTISGLTINRSSSDNVGLFGYSTGAIRNVGLVGGSVAGSSYVGGLVGINDGSISNAYATGSVTSSDRYVGGLVGINYGSISSAYATGSVTYYGSFFDGAVGGLVGKQVGGSISNAYATGTVTAGGYPGSTQGYVGGLVGWLEGGSISNSYATGSVKGDGFIGGLVGSQGGGSISNSYATGSVKGDLSIGGLVGWQRGSISNSYATGSVTFSSSGGGLIGDRVNGTITASFFDKETTGQNSGVAIGSDSGVTGLTTAQMSSLSTFTGASWDIDDKGGTGAVWRIYDGYTTPLLRSFMSALTITGSAVSKTYDGTATSTSVGQLTYSNSNYDVSQVSGAGIYTSSSANAGLYSDATLSGLYSGQSGYDITFVGGGLTIDKAALTVGVYADPRTYDGTAFSDSVIKVYYGGLAENEAPSVLGGNLTYGGSGRGAVNAGLYSITASGLTSGNYDISYQDGSLYVEKRAITVTATNATKTYGDANPALNYSVKTGNLVADDKLSGELGTDATEASGVGFYAITQGSLAASANYNVSYDDGQLEVTRRDITVTGQNGQRFYGDANPPLTYGLTSGKLVNDDRLSGAPETDATPTSGVGDYAIRQGSLDNSNYAITYVAGDLFIEQRILNISAYNATKTYGDANPTLTYQIIGQGLVNDDKLTGALETDATPTSNVGTYAITQGSLAASANYALNYFDFDNPVLTVNKAALTVTVKDASKTYDGLGYSGNNGFSYSPFVNSETASVLGGSLTFGGTSQGAVNVGSYTLTASGLTSSNYDITYVDGTLSVGQRAITITANSATKIYGDATPALTYAVTSGSLVSGDGLTGSLQTTADAASSVRTYAITQGSLNNSNYAIAYVGNALSVTKAALTVTANAATKTYDGLAYSGGNDVDYDGFVNRETVSVLGGSVAYGGTSQGAANAGTYAIAASGLTSSNYAITYVDGALSVTKAALTVTAKDASKTYDGLAYSGGNGVEYDGFVNSETTSVIGGNLTYGGTSQGAANAGTYAIAASGLTSSNYAISYVDGALSVNKAALTVTEKDATKTYDGLAYSGGNGVGYSGLVNGETASMLGGSLTFGGTSQGAVNAGTYAIAASGLTSSNYAITYADGTLSVNKAALTVAANNQTRLFNLENSPLTWTISAGTLFQGDALTGALSSAATAASPVGDYAISRGSLAASRNYDLAFLDGVLSVTPVPATALSGQFSNGNSVIVVAGNMPTPKPATQILVTGSGTISPDLATSSLGCAGAPDPTIACTAN